MSAFVTCDVMRDVTVSRLLVLWAAANEHTKDDSISNVDLSYIDRIAGLPGFGNAMQKVGWLVYDAESRIITLENFSEYNKTRSVRSAGAKSGAERQAALRARRKAEAEALALMRDGKGDVTRDVTSDHRQDERREEKENKHTGKSNSVPRADDAVCVGFDSIAPKAGVETAYRARQVVDRLGEADIGLKVHAGDTRLQAMLQQGVTVDEFADAGLTAKRNGVIPNDPVAYISAIIRSRRNQAAVPVTQPAEGADQAAGAVRPGVWSDVQSAVEAHGERLGLGRWNQTTQWPGYKAAVRAAFDAETAMVQGVE